MTTTDVPGTSTAPAPAGAPYRDRARPVDERVADLLARMTLEEKAGQLFQTMVAVGDGGTLTEDDPTFGLPGTTEMVAGRHMTHLNVLGAPGTAREMAEWYNRLQELAESTRLGIPVTVASDPRHAVTDNPGAGLLAGPFSRWPETLGLAAIGDPDLVERFADIARREYLAVGIRTALHPQVDLTTEPRWARGAGTFGEDAGLTARLGVAYVHGFQGTGALARSTGADGIFGTSSVSTMTKHFPGGGPQADGEDPHFPYGREQVYPGDRFDLHLAPFPALIAAGTRQMMPYYGMPIDLRVDLGNGPEEVEPVGFGFNRQIVTALLRERLGFDGIVCTDWGLVTDAEVMGRPFPARAWGVEHLAPLDRVLTILDAGADQLGGEACPELVVELVRSGRVDEARIDASVRRLLREKFVLGLFDDGRYVDVDEAAVVVGHPDFRAAGAAAQRASVTVLTNGPTGVSPTTPLPLSRGLRVYAVGVDARVLSEHATVVGSPAEADVAILRLSAPYEERGPGFESFFHAGSLDFPDDVLAHVREVAAAVPTVVDVYLDRPAILTPVVAAAAAVVVSFGSSDEALCDVLFGRAAPQGRLPFDLPRSTAAVEASREDVPFDTVDPLFRCGHGLEVPTDV
ncbi:glycoside hydrolase family 3 protein [Oerskovia flava]|uniref:glycoside hydrolase family 3 protein n=1 Tax=Oerskovia flava TaxID=2986422 RepID=UPI00223F3C17|nr:glycoside hydrolase family 3 N-terminal domain-containing protein [Oerskovia sp. JB1-3-2]